MKYVQINSVPNGSTGNIMMKKHHELLAEGVDSYVCWGRRREPENEREFRFNSTAGFLLDICQSFIDGRTGFHSKRQTKKLIKRLDEINPDVVHLHNLHGYYINIEMLFDWLASHHCQVKWTLHDCWSFTGHCTYFTYARCEQWETGCCANAQKCPQLHAFPPTFTQSSVRKGYKQKGKIFTSLPTSRMEIITPSHWLASLVSASFLAPYPVEVIHNTIDTSVFKPTPSDFRHQHGLEDKTIILGVASPWTKRKGLEDFYKLLERLDDSFAIVLVGLSKRQIKKAPSSIVALPRTSSAQELAQIYSAADVFFNPTKEDNYPTVCLEAQACGTPVVTYNVGGCIETLFRSDSFCINSLEDFLKVCVSFQRTKRICSE